VNTPTLDAFVIGAGVSGLTSAICLAEAGFTVAIQAAWARRLTVRNDVVQGGERRTSGTHRLIPSRSVAGLVLWYHAAHFRSWPP